MQPKNIIYIIYEHSTTGNPANHPNNSMTMLINNKNKLKYKFVYDKQRLFPEILSCVILISGHF